MDGSDKHNVGTVISCCLSAWQEAKRSFSFALNDKDCHFILNDDLGQSSLPNQNA